MHRRTRTSWRARPGLAAALLTCALGAQAQTFAPSSPTAPALPDTAPARATAFASSVSADTLPDLKQAFEAAWARQPEALALSARRDAARALRQAADAWTPEPPALEATNKTDQLNRKEGSRELEVGVAVPLWLPGERARTVALGDAEGAALESRSQAAQWRVAAAVREAWWQWQRGRIDAAVAADQLANAQRLAADVARRVQAGDLARADQHQADGAVAAAESVQVQAQATVATALQGLKALTGLTTLPDGAAGDEPEPVEAIAPLDTHVALTELQDRATVADRAASLASAQSRANPELVIAATRERGNAAEAYGQSVTVGVRIPFGAGARHDGRVALARAEAMEARAQLALERERLAAERASARLAVEAARAQLGAAERRAQLARESRGFFDQSFRLGETDLPTRLRIEAEAADAERQAARGRIELAAAVSGWRQALGLLP